MCSCDHTDDEGGIDGYFGILPVSFCPTCFSSMCDMAAQYLDVGSDGQPNDQHDKLMAHLRGVRHVVINGTYGGFGLSRPAELAWLQRTATVYNFQDREDRAATLSKGPYIMVNNQHWDGSHIARDDTVLVDIVRQMGQAVNGSLAELKIVELPADVAWQIQEYDGAEWVAEQHRTWT